MSENENDFCQPGVKEIVREAIKRQFEGAEYMAEGWLIQGMHTNALELMQIQIQALRGAVESISLNENLPKELKELAKSSVEVFDQLKATVDNIYEITKYHSEFTRDVIRISAKSKKDTMSAKTLSDMLNISSKFYTDINNFHETLQKNLLENFPESFVENKEKNET